MGFLTMETKYSYMPYDQTKREITEKVFIYAQKEKDYFKYKKR